MVWKRLACPCFKPRGQQLTKKGENEKYTHLPLKFSGYRINSWRVKSVLSYVVSLALMCAHCSDGKLLWTRKKWVLTAASYFNEKSSLISTTGWRQMGLWPCVFVRTQSERVNGRNVNTLPWMYSDPGEGVKKKLHLVKGRLHELIKYPFSAPILGRM